MEKIKESTRSRIFIVLLLSCIISSTIQTALNTALTPIMQQMNVSAGTAGWLASSYSLVMGVMVLATAYLIRRFPSRPLYLCFMGVFSLGLGLAATAASFPVLLLGRILQAIGCGLLMSLTQVVILSAYPEKERGSIMGIYGLAVCAAPVLAPTLAGVIIDLAGWQMIFWGALVLSLIVMAAGFLFMKNVTSNEVITFDTLSMILCSAGFSGLVLGFGNWSSHRLFSLPVLGAVAIGILFLLLFSLRQIKMERPFLNLTIFTNREFRLAVIASMLLYCGMMAVSTLLPLYNQSLRGFSATVSGLITMPGSLMTAVISPFAGKLYDKIGIRKLYVSGASLIFGGHFALCFLTDTTPAALIAALFLIRQCGIGMLMMTTVTWGMSTLDRKYISDGTAVISSLRTIAGAMGSALFISLMTAAGQGRSGATLTGIRTAFGGVTVISLVILVLAVWKIGAKDRN
ncbi:DHA2 family efflux MFS transporter permease subunit [Hungatella hathewayi]|uniref:DHA2 family efflux MFS transporter permease subunit n=1 Tax=Hungatella hathewayi TaxID=154046 RepID=UPI0035630FEE